MAVDDITATKTQATEDVYNSLGISALYVPTDPLIASMTVRVRFIEIKEAVPDDVGAYVVSSVLAIRIPKVDLPSYAPVRGDTIIITGHGNYSVDNIDPESKGDSNSYPLFISPLVTSTSSTTTSSTTTTTCTTTTSVSTTTTCTTTSSSCSSTASTLSTTSSISTTCSTVSTHSTTSTGHTTSSCSSTCSTLSTLSTTCSTLSTLSTLSTVSSTCSTASTLSTTSSTKSTLSTLSTLSSVSTTTSTTTSSTTTTTYWCEYNDIFDTIGKWYVEHTRDGTETIALDSGQIKVDIVDGVDSHIRALYQHKIAAGDFDITIDFGAYQPDRGTGFWADFRVSDATPGQGDNRAFIRYYKLSTQRRISFFYEINGVSSNSSWVYPAAKPTKFRLVREGTLLKGYYYITSWVLLHTEDFGAYASTIDLVKLAATDNQLGGGYVRFDNLRFLEGCPAGHPKAWTTTTSTTTTTTMSTTTTTTAPP